MSASLVATRDRMASLDWTAIARGLDERGWAVIGPVLNDGACSALAAMYDRADLFRSKVHMARHGFGRGEYQYFSYPLPEAVESLRAELYEPRPDRE